MEKHKQFNFDSAINYREEINRLFSKNVVNSKNYKYFSSKNSNIKIEDENSCAYQYVILDKVNRVLAYIGAEINNDTCNADAVELVNLAGKPNMTILRGALYFIDDFLLDQLRLNKVTFYALTDNPANKIYRKYLQTHKNNSRLVQEYSRGEDIGLLCYEVINPTMLKRGIKI